MPMGLSFVAVLSTRDSFVPRGHLARSGDIFDCHNLEGGGGAPASGGWGPEHPDVQAPSRVGWLKPLGGHASGPAADSLMVHRVQESLLHM